MLRKLYRVLFNMPVTRLEPTTFIAESTFDINPQDRLEVVALNANDEVTVIHDYGFVQATDGYDDHIDFASRVPGRQTDRYPFDRFPLIDGDGFGKGDERVRITRWIPVTM